jgi:hypothetical protein
MKRERERETERDREREREREREWGGEAIKWRNRIGMIGATSVELLSKFRSESTRRVGGGRQRRNAEDGKVGGKDEINSQVYGALKVAGISLTTWQTATGVALLAGGLRCIDGVARFAGFGHECENSNGRARARVIIHSLSSEPRGLC